MDRKLLLFGIALGMLTAAPLWGLSVGKSDLLYYEPADRIPGAEPDGKVLSGVKLVPGKFGKAYLIERRTHNYLDVPGTPACQLLWRNGVALELRRKEPFLIVSDSELALPMVDLRQGSSNTFSFDASCPGGKAEIFAQWEEPGNKVTPLGCFSVEKSVRRIVFPCRAAADSGTMRILVRGKAELSRFLEDRKCGWGASFVPYGKSRDAAWVEIRNISKHFHETEGSFSAWVKGDSLAPDSIGPGVVFFSAESKVGKGRYGRVVMWPTLLPGDGSKPGTLYFTTVDARDRRVALSERQCDLKYAPCDWHFFVFTWKQVDKRMQIAIYVDGDKLKISTDGEAIGTKQAIKLTVGYYGGCYLNGAMDDFAFFGRVLTAAEVLDLYRSDRPLGEILK